MFYSTSVTGLKLPTYIENDRTFSICVLNSARGICFHPFSYGGWLVGWFVHHN